jgi:plasmid stability protein
MHARYSPCVPKNVQIRNLDDATYRELRRRAAAEDLSLAQYLRRELDRMATTTTMADILARADARRARGAAVTRDEILAALEADRAERGD